MMIHDNPNLRHRSACHACVGLCGACGVLLNGLPHVRSRIGQRAGWQAPHLARRVDQYSVLETFALS